MEGTTLEAVCKAYIAYAEFTTRPDSKDFQKYETGHIFDEEQSVRWNKEEVIRRNNAYKAEFRRLSDEKNELYLKAKGLILDYITENSKINDRTKAEILWNYVNERYDITERIEAIDDLLETLNRIF